MDVPLFTLRTAEARDLVYLQMICDEGGLAIIEDVEDVTVAVNDEDLPVGFIHIETVTSDMAPATSCAYVYPIAVFEAWQRHGVASALIEYELANKGELRLVACKPSQGFYPKAGFEPTDWDNIAPRIAQDCTRCTARDACAPVPFRKKR